MCGINGYIGKNVSKKILQDMNNSMRYRGPDDSGFSIQETVGLAQLRLSILDLSSAGHQPMFYDRKNLSLIFNGEIYNFQELKKQLQKKGHKFKSKTDSEVILASYKEWGTNCLKKFNGMFAFALFDKKNNQLLLARDRLGIKPLYYTKTKNEFMFSSEIKGIFATKKIQKELNPEALIEYLRFQNTFGKKTFFKNIRLVEPGTYILINTKTNQVTTKSFYTVSYNTNNFKKQSFQDLLNRSIKRQLISDVPVGTYLSGGFDSTSVTMLASKYKKNLHTFTAAFNEGGEFDERKYSRIVAKKSNASLHEIIIMPEMLKKELKKVIHHLDEPTKLGRSLAQYKVAQLAKKKVTVTLTGHGGDELFAGYPVFLAKLFAQRIKKNPLTIFPISYQILKHSSRLNIIYYLFFPLFQRDVKLGLIGPFTKNQSKKLLKKTISHDPTEYIKKITKKEKSSLVATLKIYLKTFLPTLFLVEDRMSMAHSIESRVPVCDNELIDYALTEPFSIKLKHNTLKNTIKEDMKSLLPSCLYSASKKGFPNPYGLWFKGPLKSYLEEKLLGKNAKIKELFNEKEIKKILAKRRTHPLIEQQLWMLLNIELWLEEHF